MAGSLTTPPPKRYLTAAFYLFVDLPDCAQFKTPLQALCDAEQVKGLILLAPEGINSTIAGPAQGVQAVLGWLRAQAQFALLQHKESWSSKAPFRRMRVRIKKEIVTMGVPGLRPASQAGRYVSAQDWKALRNCPHGWCCKASSIRPSRARWPCFALAVSAVKSPPPFCAARACKRFITSKVAS